ncbi:hypothetical protein C8T65DRAFT_729557 [Cerioporus squamosus]|nr:hypothetical protein C8T65DRAFT_729557 [Cerioporus squamosus]
MVTHSRFCAWLSNLSPLCSSLGLSLELVQIQWVLWARTPTLPPLEITDCARSSNPAWDRQSHQQHRLPEAPSKAGRAGTLQRRILLRQSATSATYGLRSTSVGGSMLIALQVL